MRIRALCVVAAICLPAGGALAAPVISSSPLPVLALVPGTMTTISFSIVPEADGVEGFAAFFEVSDAPSIVIAGCSSPADPELAAPICPAGGSSFNFAALDFDPTRTSEFPIGSVMLTIPVGATVGTTLSITGASSITTGTFAEVDLSPSVFAQVVPEPNTFLLAGLGLAWLSPRSTAARRRRERRVCPG